MVLAHLTLGSWAADPFALEAVDNLGAIRIAVCFGLSMQAINSKEIAFSGTEVRGFVCPTPGAVLSDVQAMAAYETQIKGNVVDCNTIFWTQGTGMELSGDSTVFLVVSTIRGGGGVSHPCYTCGHFPNGGLGLDCGAGSAVELLGGNIYGGAESCEYCYATICSEPGVALQGPGTVTTLPGVARRLMTSVASAIEGSTATVVLSGLPGDRAYLLRSSDTTNMFVPAKSGTQLYATPISLRTMLGTLTSTGLVVQVPFEDVMPPGSARVEYWQLQVTPAGMPLDHRV